MSTQGWADLPASIVSSLFMIADEVDNGPVRRLAKEHNAEGITA
jgi:hypothetical protein